MRVFAAASTGKAPGGGNEDAYDRFMEEVAYPNVLIAFPYDPACDFVNGRLRYRPDFVLTDSGAYTVWKSGGKVDPAAYLRYCLRYRERLAAGEVPSAVHVSLDVIPGEWGRQPTAAERRRGMQNSLANGDELRAENLPIMEVFHQFEPLDFLDHLVDRLKPGDLLGISPRQGLGQATRRRFLDGVWHHLTTHHASRSKDHGSLIVPACHGLGVGGRELIARYPWWSTDSLTWTSPGVFGRPLTRAGTQARVQQRERTTGVTARRRYCEDYLRRYLKWERECTAMWAGRGVTWLNPPS